MVNIFQKKMTLIGDVFTGILAPINIVWELSRKPCFRGPLERQHDKSAETL